MSAVVFKDSGFGSKLESRWLSPSASHRVQTFTMLQCVLGSCHGKEMTIWERQSYSALTLVTSAFCEAATGLLQGHLCCCLTSTAFAKHILLETCPPYQTNSLHEQQSLELLPLRGNRAACMKIRLLCGREACTDEREQQGLSLTAFKWCSR